MDNKTLARALGYYAKAHEGMEKIAECFPDEWVSDVDLQIAFQKGWQEARDETPVQMNVTMDLKPFKDELLRGMQELRAEMLALRLDQKGTDTNTAIPRIYLDPGVCKVDDVQIDYPEDEDEEEAELGGNPDLGSVKPGTYTFDTATGMVLDDFADFYKIQPRFNVGVEPDSELRESDEHLRERIRFAHQHNHPNRYPGGKTATQVIEESAKSNAEFAREYIENLGLERLDNLTDLRKRYTGLMNEPGTDYDAVEKKWVEWQAANQKAFSEKDKRCIADVDGQKYYWDEDKEEIRK